MKFARKVLREDARRQGKLPGEKTLRLVMASLVAMQSFAPIVAAAEAPVASQITRVDGTSVNFNNGVADVYAEKVQGNLGINRFTDFSVAEKNTANMYFKEQGGSAEATDLVNFVSNRIDIAGTVNALQGSDVGGHLLFVSPEGMVVTSTGVINAGSLTIATPTEDYFEKMKLDPKATGEKAEIVNIFSSELTDAQLTKLMTNYTADTMVPATLALNSDGSIAIAGQINVKTAATLMAGKVDVGSTGVVRNAMDFSQISKLGAADQTALSEQNRLDLTKDAYGNIVLRGVTETTVDGKVDAGNGAAIVKAENEVTVDLTAEDAEKAGLVNFDAAASSATVTVNGSVKGASVDVSAKATATFKGNIVNKPAEKKEGEGSADDKAKTEKIAEGAKKTGALKKISDTAKKFFDKANVLMDESAAGATVSIGQNAKVESTAGDTSIRAESAVKNDLSLTIQPTVTKKAGDKESKSDDVTTTYFSGASIYNGSTSAANVTILGDVKAKGNLTISADATNASNVATTIQKANAEEATSYMNAVVNVVNQTTAAAVNLADGAKISAGGALKATANTDTALDVSAKIATDNKAVVSTAINLVGTETDASISVDTTLTGASVETSAKNTVSKLNITTDNAYEKTGADDSASGGASGGSGDASGGSGDSSSGSGSGETSGDTPAAGDEAVEENVIETEATAPADDGETSAAAALKALLGSDDASEKEESGILAANKDADEKSAATSGDTDAVKDEKGTTATDTEQKTEMKGDGATEAEQKASSAAKEKKEAEKKATGWNEYVDIGASVMVGNFKNAATVAVGPTGKIVSAGDATVKADTELAKSSINTVNTLLNTNTDTKAVVSAAVAVKNMKNNASVILAGSDTKHDSISAGGAVNLSANVVDQPADADDKQEATMVTQAFVATDVGDEGKTVIPFGATGTVGIEKVTGNANVYIGKNAKVTAGGAATIESTVSGQDVMQAGKEVIKKETKKDEGTSGGSEGGGSSEAGGSSESGGDASKDAAANDDSSTPTSSGNKVGLGGTVAVQNRYMNAKTEVAAGAEITAGAIALSSKNKTTAAASAVAARRRAMSA